MSRRLRPLQFEQMTDIFREIDEDLRRDRYSSLLRRLAPLLIAIIVLIIVGVGSWQGWRYYQRQNAESAGDRFEAALTELRGNKTDDAVKTLEALAASGPDGYKLVSRFRLAALAAERDANAGAEAFAAIADDAKLEAAWRELARLRSVSLKLGSMSAEEVQAALQPLAAPGRTWRHNALELLGLSALQAGKLEDAGRWFDQLMTDSETPAALRQRVQTVYLALVSGGNVK